jgi:endonuclease/exonuclease/phosphatase family metal-dependent hydrolase
MRMLVYNIRYAAGTGRQFHFPFPGSGYVKTTGRNMKRITRFIRSVKPDIVGLVEVDTGSYRSARQNQASELARELCFKAVHSTKYGEASLACRLPLLCKQGNAVLTNQEIVDRQFHYLNNGMKRLVIELELRDMRLFLVHLSLKYRSRRRQLQDLSRWVNDSSKPAVVAGDFNAFRGALELEGFMEDTGLVLANGNGLPSHPSRAPRRHLDHILHSPSISCGGLTTPRVTYSDHVPLVWDFHLR